MDLLLAVGVWVTGAWLAYRCVRWAGDRADHAGHGGATPVRPRGVRRRPGARRDKRDRATARRGWTSGGDAVLPRGYPDHR
jgi:hypothetical protein